MKKVRLFLVLVAATALIVALILSPEYAEQVIRALIVLVESEACGLG